MKVTKHAYELVKVTEGTDVSSYTIPVARVTAPYILTVRGARAVYEVNADARIAPVSTTAHVSIDNDGAELDGDPTTYAQRKTTANKTEDVKTYDFGAIKPLFVSATYSASSNTKVNVVNFEMWAWAGEGTTWTRVFFGNSKSKTTVHFFTIARYLRWVNRNHAIDSSVVGTTNLYELEAYDCRRTTIVSYPDEFDCIIHEAQRKTAANGSKWYTLLIEPYEGLAYDYWLYKLRPAMGYYKVTLE